MSTSTITLPAGFVADESVKFPKRAHNAKTIVSLAEGGEYTVVVGKYSDPDYTYHTSQDAVFVRHNLSDEAIAEVQRDYVVASHDANVLRDGRTAWGRYDNGVFVEGLYLIQFNEVRKARTLTAHWDGTPMQGVVAYGVSAPYVMDDLGAVVKSETPVQFLRDEATEAKAGVAREVARRTHRQSVKAQPHPNSAYINAWKAWLESTDGDHTVTPDDPYKGRRYEADIYRQRLILSLVRRLVARTIVLLGKTTDEVNPLVSRQDDEVRWLTVEEAVCDAILSVASDTHLEDGSTPFFRKAVDEFRHLIRYGSVTIR